jgi:hypothetical protein
MTARKHRDAVRVSALRSALSAIDNAETPDAVAVTAQPSSEVAGAVAGLSAAEDVTAGGHPERADTLRAEATVLADLLGDV